MSIESHDVTARDGLRLRLWEASGDDPDRAVLFVHGATYASRAIFALPDHESYSWLASVAADGNAGFALDVRGYGDSERPPEMTDPGDDEDAPVRAETAAEDVRDAIDAVRERTDASVHLVGTSWGTIILGTLLTGADAPDVASVTMHAPVYAPDSSLVERFDFGAATRTVGRADALARWNDQVPLDVPARLRGGDAEDDPAFEAFWGELSGSGQQAGPDSIVAPNGTLVDLREAATEGPLYDASGIDLPTLVVRGTLDTASTRADALGLFDDLETPETEVDYVELAGGTHFVHLERRRGALYEAVRSFQAQH